MGRAHRRSSLVPPQRTLSWPGATGLAEDVRRYGKWMRDEAEKRIGHLYPRSRSRVSRRRSSPGSGRVRSPALTRPARARCRSSGRSGSARRKARSATSSRSQTVSASASRSAARTAFRAKARSVAPARSACICGTPVPLSYIRDEGKAGRMGAQLMAIAAEGKRQRYYVAPTEEHEKAADVPRPDDVPEAELPIDPRRPLAVKVTACALGLISSPTASSPPSRPSAILFAKHVIAS